MGHRDSGIDPELRAATLLGRIPVNARTLWLWRMLIGLMRTRHVPDDMLIRNTRIPARDDDTRIRLRIYSPRAPTAPTPALLWLHGGGYVMGRPEMNDRWCIQCVRELGIAVVSVDYCLAPEHPYPAPLEDAYSALSWLADEAGPPGIDPTRIAIGGSSAGGGLAAALAQLAHDRGKVEPVFQLLVYPMLDDRTSFRTDLAEDIDLGWSQESNRFGWAAYLKGGSPSADPPTYAVPAQREDLSGLPPAWIGVGTHDLFRDESAAYTRKLEDSGVDCELTIAPGAPHGFEIAAPHTRPARAFRASQISALRKHIFA